MQDVLYVDDDIVVVNKPSGLLCVPGRVEKDSLATRYALGCSVLFFLEVLFVVTPERSGARPATTTWTLSMVSVDYCENIYLAYGTPFEISFFSHLVFDRCMKVASSDEVGLVVILDGCWPRPRLACSFIHVARRCLHKPLSR